MIALETINLKQFPCNNYAKILFLIIANSYSTTTIQFFHHLLFHGFINSFSSKRAEVKVNVIYIYVYT